MTFQHDPSLFLPPCAIGGGLGCNKDFKTQLKFPKLVAVVRHETRITVFHLRPPTNLRQNKCLLYQPPFFPLFWRKCSKDIRSIKHSRQRKPAFLWASNFFNNILNETFDKGIVLLSCHGQPLWNKGETKQLQQQEQQSHCFSHSTAAAAAAVLILYQCSSAYSFLLSRF